MKYGMSDELGPVFLASGHEVFLGKDFGQTPEYSETTAAKIDAEVTKIVEGAYGRAKEILSTNLKKLINIGEVLMRKEKLTGEEFKRLFEDEIDVDDPNAWAVEEKKDTEKEPEPISPPDQPIDAEAVETIIVTPPKPEDT